jgi:hypothetical protein
MTAKDYEALEALDLRLRTMLPEEYHDSYESLEPVPMGSAGLKYDIDGRVAWGEIWESFCDLAMAGGPPHKGALLEPASKADVDAQPDRYTEVAEEICRGVVLATELDARRAAAPGWIRVMCYSETMAAWLLRAIVMENVAAQCEGRNLHLPAAPHFRLEKEIKNVITVIAKTSHYWLGHIPRTQRQAIAVLFSTLEAECPLIEPAPREDDFAPAALEARRAGVGAAIQRQTGLRPSDHAYDGWVGLECPNVQAAVWLMRALVVSNVLARREGTVLFVPIDPVRDSGGERVVTCVTRTYGLAIIRRLV